MTWVKLDDGFYDHPKVIAAGDEAIGLYCRALTYCGRYLTDGRLPAQVASRLGSRKSIKRLLNVGLWVEVEDGYEVPGFLDYNPSRELVAGKRTKTAERVRRWRERNAVTNGDGNGGSNPAPDPTRPGAELPGSSPSPPGRARESGDADEGEGSPALADQVFSILDSGVASLSENDHGRPWPGPSPSAIRDALARYGPDGAVALAVAREVREIVQAQDRAPNVSGLYAKRLAGAVTRAGGQR